MTRRRWTARRWAREYVRAYRDLFVIAEQWLPPLHWHAELYRQVLDLRREFNLSRIP